MKNLNDFKAAATQLIQDQTELKNLVRRKSDLELRQIEIEKQIDKITTVVVQN